MRRIDLYAAMRRSRSFEERVAELFVRGGTAGSMLHLSIGEEAAAALTLLLKEGDSITSHHRGHGIFLIRGADPARMMAEIAGKQTGYCGGKGGSMHIADREFGHHGANAIVGGGIPHSVGAAYAYKLRGQKRLAAAFFGDGALQQGLLYESMNIAALYRLPAVFVCINNQYGMGTNIRQASASLEFVKRAESFGLAGVEADGSDAEATLAAAKPLFAEARAKGRPALVVVNCYRFFGHARMDKSPYRSDAEERKGRKLDPLARLRSRLVDGAKAGELDRLDEDIASEMDAAVEAAIEADQPPPEEVFTGVYASSEPAPQPLRERISRILAE